MVEIRDGTAADRSRLQTIQRQALEEPWPELLDAACGGALPLFVAETDRVVGYAVVIPGEEGVSYLPELAVAPGEQGAGYGSTLLSTVCTQRRALGDTLLWLTVRADDERVRSFYRKHGFERRETLPEQFDAGDGMVFVTELE